MVGFCVADVKLFGPLHEYVAPAMVVEVKLNVLPVQTGLFAVATIAGVWFTVTVVVPAGLVHPPEVAVTE